MAIASTQLKERFKLWFFQGLSGARRQAHNDKDVWWKVVCLTGVDYFSSLGYAPGIAFLAAGFLSPLASIILVLLNLVGALPVYQKVAQYSPHGQGSISMLAGLLPRWKGKALVLCLLGFAATDFVITITLSSADAAAHVVQNPWVPLWLQNRMLITMFMILVLGSVFLKGFREAIGISFVLVTIYLTLNFVVVAFGLYRIALHPLLVTDWISLLFAQYQSPWKMLAISVLIFPKLALGMSGFETGVAVMPHVEGDPGETEEHPLGRIRNTRKMLAAAAVIMGFFLITSSFVTAVLIPPQAFQEGGEANGRALAYLAHRFFGDNFGSIYDASTILILWFAGASAMAGLLNLVPQYLPRYGMAPNWAAATRPLVLFFVAVAFAVTMIFHADVDAQGGAYATGVLVLMTSAAFASSLIVWKKSRLQRWCFSIITLIFVYTTITNIVQRPEGLHIASFFICTILVLSLVSRAMRSTELRVRRIILDQNVKSFIEEACGYGAIRIVSHRPGPEGDYAQSAEEARRIHNLPKDAPILFLEVTVGDASEFSSNVLHVHGAQYGQFKILRCVSAAVPNAIAALLLYIRDKTHSIPHIYMGWTEGNPITYILKYLFFGEGETAPITREILREAEPVPQKRPRVHVG